MRGTSRADCGWCTGDGCSVRRTRSSHPWALTTRHPWRVMVRRAEPPPPERTRPCDFVRGATSRRQCSADGQPIQVTTPNASVPAKRPARFDPRWIRAIRRRWRRVAPDRHAPWMARGERPGTARASPAQHTATSAVISAPHPQTSPFRQISSTTQRSSHYRLGRYRLVAAFGERVSYDLFEPLCLPQSCTSRA